MNTEKCTYKPRYDGAKEYLSGNEKSTLVTYTQREYLSSEEDFLINEKCPGKNLGCGSGNNTSGDVDGSQEWTATPPDSPFDIENEIEESFVMEDEEEIKLELEKSRQNRDFPEISMSPIREEENADFGILPVPSMDSLKRRQNLGSRLKRLEEGQLTENEFMYECTKRFLEDPTADLEIRSPIPVDRDLLNKTFRPCDSDDDF
uniref:Fibrous sheath-interacting protein 1 n=1 Tax=Parastrongyloides trichosuri TaxID=131310 RepID=A0A0N4Z5K7_PARTI